MSILGSTQFFRLFHDYFGWGYYPAYALSLAIVTTLLFLWNYFIGFKTDRHWTHAAWRQVVCQIGCVALDYLLVTTLIGIFRSHESLIISVVKVFVAVLVKFALYHYWIYPQRAAAGGEVGEVSDR